jgi:hypothetical protein
MLHISSVGRQFKTFKIKYLGDFGLKILSKWREKWDESTGIRPKKRKPMMPKLSRIKRIAFFIIWAICQQIILSVIITRNIWHIAIDRVYILLFMTLYHNLKWTIPLYHLQEELLPRRNHTPTVEPLLTDTSRKRTPLVHGHCFWVPANTLLYNYNLS